MIGFYRDFGIVVLLSALGAYLTAAFYLNIPVPTSFWLSLGFIAILSLVIHQMLFAAAKKRPQLFVAWFMGALTAKLFLSAILMVIVGLTDPDNLKFTAIGFLISYILLTVVEIRHLLPLMKNVDK